MPFSGSSPNKTFSRTSGLQTGATTWTQTEAAGRGIEESDHDTHDQDLAAAINTSWQKDGSNKLTANANAGGFKIEDLGTPTAATDAASKSYVDGVVVSFTNFTARGASTANVNLTTDVDAGSSFDGLTLVEADRILLKNQTLPAENGIYAVPAAAGTATRVGDMDAFSETVGAIVNVTAGTAGANTAWRSTTAAGGTINVTAVNFVSFGTSLSTPVSLANGGTAATSAVDAFTNIKQAATTTATGVIELATTAEFWAATAGTIPTVATIIAAGAEVTVTDGATVTLDLSIGINFKLAIGGNRTLAVSNYTDKVGRSGYFKVTQDVTGTRTLNSTAAAFVNANATDIVLSTPANTVDLIFYQVIDVGGTTKVFLTIHKAIG